MVSCQEVVTNTSLLQDNPVAIALPAIGQVGMDVINIFVSDAYDGTLDEFVHDDRKFVFGLIGADGPQQLAEGPVFVFIDWIMEDLAGLELCRRLRADPRFADAHLTMVLEEDEIDARRRALRAGADDYVVGPLSRRDLLDRVLRLQADQVVQYSARAIEYGNLTIDSGALQARWAGKPIALRPNEFRLLCFLVENPNRVLTRADLINGLGKREPQVDERTVDVWIGRLRRAIRAAGGDNLLRTVRSVGYVFDLP